MRLVARCQPSFNTAVDDVDDNIVGGADDVVDDAVDKVVDKVVGGVVVIIFTLDVCKLVMAA